MGFSPYRELKHCRWCGNGYYASKPRFKSGFCCRAHKQAHYRAYKKYVTATLISTARLEAPAVTPNKSKSRK